MMHPILTGLVATVLALVQVVGWVSIGSIVLAHRFREEIWLPGSILVGSGITAFVYAFGAYFGLVDPSILASAVFTVGAVVLSWRRLVSGVAALWRQAELSWRGNRPLTAAVAAGVILLWIDAIVPPRDGDVMRYHLAHVRQIIREGRWVAVSDYHYALPFGWTMNFLPFERIGLPIAAHVLTLQVWCAMLLCMIVWLRQRGVSHTGLAILGLIAAHPVMVKAVTTAHADLYSMLVVLVVAMVIARESHPDTRHATLLGFASWIGAQSRYQLVAIGLVASVIMLAWVVRRHIAVRAMVAYSLGAITGLALATPFYVANYRAFDNPVWPLLVRQINGLGSYANRVANHVNETLSGALRQEDVVRGLAGLMTDSVVFPFPVLVLALCVAAPWSRNGAVRRLATFAVLFAALWLAMQPLLLPRFILFFVPLAALGLPLAATDFLGRSRSVPLFRAAQGAIAAAIIGFGAIDVWYSKDSVVYVLTGNERSFHRATWYYPVYQWANRETPRDARFLVIVGSSHTYYLDRFYRRAEPYLNGEIDWENVPTGRALADSLRARQFDYVIYEARDWSTVLGGTELGQAVDEAMRNGELTLVKRFDLKLVTGRVRGTSVPTTVYVLRCYPVPGAG